MKFPWVILFIIILISIPHMSAKDTSDWSEVTVNKVTFKIPQKYVEENMNESYATYYFHGTPNNFGIKSCFQYNILKDSYGLYSTSNNVVDIEETNIKGHDAVIFYYYNDFRNIDELHIYFTTGKKIFYIYYQSDKVTPELEKIIKSTPKSKISEEAFLNKLDNAQRDYIQEDYEKNLELDLEDYYRDYNNQHNRQVYSYWGSNGYGIGSIYSL